MSATMLRACRAALALVALPWLAACGGGSDAPAPGPAPSPGGAAPVLTPLPGPAATAATCGQPDFQAALLERINRLRASGASCGSAGSFAAAALLTWHPALAEASAAHSRDMAANAFFSHTGSDGSSAGQRMSRAGYAWRGWAENIAAGYPTVDAVMDGWIASPGHCANLMNPTLREVGVACVPGGGSAPYATYWTMNLGLR